MKKMMIAINDINCSKRAITYVEKQFAGAEDLEITVVHVLPDLLAMFWDDGHILNEEERQKRQKVIDTWLDKQKEKVEPIMQAAVDGFVGTGFRAEQIKTKLIKNSTDVADGILEEARNGGYLTVIMGRRGVSEGRHLFMGSVTTKVVHRGAGVAITIVE